MSHRNNKLSFIAGADIHMGRAVKMQTDGTVIEITDKDDLVIGWAAYNALSGAQIALQTIFNGTITVEIVPSSSLHSGMTITLNDDGRIKAWTSAIDDESALMGYLITRMTAASDGIYAEALMLRNLNKWDQPDP